MQNLVLTTTMKRAKQLSQQAYAGSQGILKRLTFKSAYLLTLRTRAAASGAYQNTFLLPYQCTVALLSSASLPDLACEYKLC